MPCNWLWGYDFFISYHWDSGSRYAVALAQRLRKKHFDVFLDRAEYADGDDWKKIGAIALRNTRRLLLIATREAVTNSQPVAREVRLFTRDGRHVIPIVFIERYGTEKRSTLAGLNAAEHIVLAKLPDSKIHIPDDVDNLSRGPSDETVRRLVQTHRVLRRRNVRVILVGFVFATLASFAAFATTSWINAIFARGAAEAARDLAASERDSARRTLARNYWNMGRNQRDTFHDAVKAAHYFTRASEVFDEQQHVQNCLLAANLSTRRVKLESLMEHEGTVIGAHLGWLDLCFGSEVAITARLPKQHFSLPEDVGGVRLAERSETFRSDAEGFLYALARELSPVGPERRNCVQDPGICPRRSAFSNRASMFPPAEIVFTDASWD